MAGFFAFEREFRRRPGGRTPCPGAHACRVNFRLDSGFAARTARSAAVDQEKISLIRLLRGKSDNGSAATIRLGKAAMKGSTFPPP
jgi:hypothetical protein